MAIGKAFQEITEASRSRANRAAQGLEPFDLLLEGGQIVDVITGEVRPADVGIVDNMIASVHSSGSRHDAAATHGVSGMLLSPGLIDTHVHIESSHLLPEHYAATVVPQGTTTIFYDPHELANVLGVDGIRYAVEATRSLPLRCLCQASSSVPSAPGLEVSGASFGGSEISEMLDWPEVIGVAEMMDMKGVLGESERMVAIAAEARRHGKLLEGHARGLTGGRLQAYVAAGIGSDHEITTGDDFLEKLRAGLAIQLRGSHDYVLPMVLEAMQKLPHLSSQIMICTDDVPPDLLLEAGGMVDVLRRFIRHGMKPMDALRFATFNAALYLGRRDLGAICPGRIADIVLFTQLDALALADVYVSGKLAARGGRMIEPIVPPKVELPCDTMKLAPLTVDQFRIPVPGVNEGTARLRSIKGVRFSEWSEVSVQVCQGHVVLPEDGEFNFLFTMHRHNTYGAQPQRAIQEGLARLRGAIATTYEHDSHNLYVIGGNEEDMQLAANTLIVCGGGIAVVSHGQLLAVAELPIAGMLSAKEPEKLASEFKAVREAAGKVATWKLPYWIFKTLEGMSLACNPFPHLTDLGLFDGKTGERVELVLHP